MAWNDITYALELCRTRPDLAAVQHDRRACNVPLWIEEDQGGPDAVLDDIEARAEPIAERGRGSAPRRASTRSSRGCTFL